MALSNDLVTKGEASQQQHPLNFMCHIHNRHACTKIWLKKCFYSDAVITYVGAGELNYLDSE